MKVFLVGREDAGVGMLSKEVSVLSEPSYSDAVSFRGTIG